MLIQLMVKVPGTSKVIVLNGLNASKELLLVENQMFIGVI
jgi:hypothetical protein